MFEGMLKQLIFKNKTLCFKTGTIYFERCGVEVWSKFRPNFDPRNFDQTSTPQVSKFGLEVWSKFGRCLVEVWCRSLVDILSNLLCSSLIYRANFDQTSTLGGVEVWSEFRPNFDTGGSKFDRNFDQTSTPTSFKRTAQCAVRSAHSRIRRRIPEIP